MNSLIQTTKEALQTKISAIIFAILIAIFIRFLLLPSMKTPCFNSLGQFKKSLTILAQLKAMTLKE